MHFEKKKTFENSSIHFRIQTDFLAHSAASSGDFNEIGSKNGSLSIDRESVLQDLMDSSARSARPTQPETADARLPFFTNHRNSGQRTLLNNVKKYRLMKQLGMLAAGNKEPGPERPKAKKTRSDKTWKSSDKSRERGSRLDIEWPIRKRRRPKLKKRRNWTVTEFGRVEEPRNLLFDIKKRMRLGSDCKRELLRDDARIRSVLSFGNLEDEARVGQAQSAESGDLGQGIPALNQPNTAELTNKNYFCRTPKIKKKEQKSPPKLKKKCAFKQRVSIKDMDLEFLRTEEKLLTKQLEQHILDLRQSVIDSSLEFANRTEKPKRPNPKKRFISGFHELFSKNLSSSSEQSKSMRLIQKTLNLSDNSNGVARSVASEKGAESTALYTHDQSQSQTKQFNPNWSLGRENGLENVSVQFDFLNKSVGQRQTREKKGKREQRLGLFFGKKMSKSKGDRPDERQLASKGESDVRGNWIKKTTFSKSKIFNDIESPIQAGSQVFSDRIQNSEGIFGSPFLESKCSIPKNPEDCKFSIYNQNTITFCPKDIFGECENLFGDSNAKPENPRNPFEDIDLNLGMSEDSDWGEMLGDPTKKQNESGKREQTHNLASPAFKNVFVSF